MSMTTSPQTKSGGTEEDKLAAGTKVVRLNEDQPRTSKPKCELDRGGHEGAALGEGDSWTCSKIAIFGVVGLAPDPEPRG